MKTLLILFIGILSATAYAQDGTLDTSFGINGYAITDFYGNDDNGSKVRVLDDNKILVLGFVNEIEPYNYGLVRYMPNGELDLTFGTNGKVFTPIEDSDRFEVCSLNIQSDQKIITSRTAIDSENEDERYFMLMRYMPNGELDTAFGTNGILKTDIENGYLSNTVQLTDGKLLAVGGKTIDTQRNLFLIRYLPNGQLDPTFGNGGMLTQFINNFSLGVLKPQIQNDGKILIPFTTTQDEVYKTGIIRLSSNGEIDSTFGTNGIIEYTSDNRINGTNIALQPDGKILQSFDVYSTNTTTVKRYLPDGLIDESFGSNGTTEIFDNIFYVSKMIVEDNGNIIILGPTYNFEFFASKVFRLNANGIVDTTFGTEGSTELQFIASDLAFQGTNLILSGDDAFVTNNNSDFVTARLFNGTLSTPEFENTNFKIYPNPSTGIFTVESNSISDTTTYQITDVTGKTIQSGTLLQGQTQIDLSSAQSGIYFLSAPNRVYRLIKN